MLGPNLIQPLRTLFEDLNGPALAGIPESTGARSRDLGHLPAEGLTMHRALRP